LRHHAALSAAATAAALVLAIAPAARADVLTIDGRKVSIADPAGSGFTFINGQSVIFGLTAQSDVSDATASADSSDVPNGAQPFVQTLTSTKNGGVASGAAVLDYRVLVVKIRNDDSFLSPVELDIRGNLVARTSGSGGPAEADAGISMQLFSLQISCGNDDFQCGIFPYSGTASVNAVGLDFLPEVGITPLTAYNTVQLTSRSQSQDGSNAVAHADPLITIDPSTLDPEDYMIFVSTGFGNSELQSDGVPEPAAWAMMLLGFAGIGAAARSRRSPVFG
jgi:PEP-CTERM motif